MDAHHEALSVGEVFALDAVGEGRGSWFEAVGSAVVGEVFEGGG